jgi:hypothetical protein
MVNGNQKKRKSGFSMMMPDWFIELEPEQKKIVIANMKNKISAKHANAGFHKLTDDELKKLMVSST